MGNIYVAVNVHAVLYHIAMHINNVHPRCMQDVKLPEHPHITVLMEVYHYHRLEGSTDEQDCLQILSQKNSSHKTVGQSRSLLGTVMWNVY